MFAALRPGSPEVWRPATPGVLPMRALEMLETGADRMSLPFTEEMAPVTFTFFWVAKAVTTTSSIRLVSIDIVTSRTACDAGTVFARVVYPMNWNSRTTCPAGTRMEYLPSKSVETPLEVPCWTTKAPYRGSPRSSKTVPPTVRVPCACSAGPAVPSSAASAHARTVFSVLVIIVRFYLIS